MGMRDAGVIDALAERQGRYLVYTKLDKMNGLQLLDMTGRRKQAKNIATAGWNIVTSSQIEENAVKVIGCPLIDG